MKDQINTIRYAIEMATPHYQADTERFKQALTALTQLEAMAGEQEPVQLDHIACIDGGELRYMTGRKAPAYDCELYAMPDGKRAAKLYAAPVAQQPQAEPDAYCITTPDGGCISTDPRCMHQPQAEAVPVVDRVYEAAKRLVDHADFQLGGVLSAKSKARDIPSNAASKVKARHLASLRDALAKTTQQAEAVPPDVVRDAKRYRWLRNESWAGYNTGKGTPSVYTVDGAGNRRMMLAEEAMDDAIDAAIAQQKGGV